MDIIQRARELRKIIEKMAQGLDDDTASITPEIFSPWSGDSIIYKAGEKISYKGKTYRVLMDHVSQPDWTPDAAHSLFAEILYEGDIKEWVQPDSTNPYMKGDKVRYVGKKWQSLVDYNVWQPGAVGTETLWQEI